MGEQALPEWLRLELAAAHPGIEVKWIDFEPRRKVFVIPVTGDAYWRMPVSKLGGAVLYRRHITHGTAAKWRLHAQTYMPDAECVTSGRWVVFQTNVATGDVVKMFDVLHDDGSWHQLDRRVLLGISVRDGKHGAHEKAISDVEAAPVAAEAAARDALGEAMAPALDFMYWDIKRHAQGGANDPRGSDAENEVQIEN